MNNNNQNPQFEEAVAEIIVADTRVHLHDQCVGVAKLGARKAHIQANAASIEGGEWLPPALEITLDRLPNIPDEKRFLVAAGSRGPTLQIKRTEKDDGWAFALSFGSVSERPLATAFDSGQIKIAKGAKW